MLFVAVAAAVVVVVGGLEIDFEVSYFQTNLGRFLKFLDAGLASLETRQWMVAQVCPSQWNVSDLQSVSEFLIVELEGRGAEVEEGESLARHSLLACKVYQFLADVR